MYQVRGNAGADQYDVSLWHVAIAVSDLDRSIEFYCGKLGLLLLGLDECETKRQAFVQVASCGSCLELYQPRPATQQSLRQRPDHLAFECVDIEATAGRLKDLGLHCMTGVVDFGNGVRQFSMVDPDGLNLEFFQGRAIYDASLSPGAAAQPVGY